MNINSTTYSPAIRSRNHTASRRSAVSGYLKSNGTESAAGSQDTVTISARIRPEA